jgi:hypothetical protein
VKIVCLVKQIPRPDAIEFDPETKSLRRVNADVIVAINSEASSPMLRAADVGVVGGELLPSMLQLA